MCLVNQKILETAYWILIRLGSGKVWQYDNMVEFSIKPTKTMEFQGQSFPGFFHIIAADIDIAMYPKLIELGNHLCVIDLAQDTWTAS